MYAFCSPSLCRGPCKLFLKSTSLLIFKNCLSWLPIIETGIIEKGLSESFQFGFRLFFGTDTSLVALLVDLH